MADELRAVPAAVTASPSFGDLPFRHFALDGFLTRRQLRDCAAAWPGPDWPGWVRTPDERQPGKRVSDLTTPLPPAIAAALARVAALPVGSWLGLPDAVADLSLRGGGLHEIHPGANLNPHLDADTHARLGLRRAWSAVVYVHEEWSPGDGGELLLMSDADAVVARLDPAPGRLVAFDARDAWHAVAPVSRLAGPRRSLAIFGYLPEAGGGLRQRAVFAGTTK